MKLSKLTLGTVQLGMNYGINNQSGMPDEQKSFEILRTALDGGVTVLDTASNYGCSEDVIGKFLSNYSGEHPTIVTKFEISNAPSLTVKEAERNLRNEIENSLERLYLSKLPFLLYHDETEFDRWTDRLEDVFRRLIAEGLVDKVGVSIQTSSVIGKILSSDLYEAIQVPMNIFDTSLVRDGFIGKLKNAGVCVFVRSVFLQGLFFKNPDDLPDGVLQSAKGPLKQLKKFAQDEGMSIAELAFSFIRDIDGISSLVLGAETPEQVKQNLTLQNAKVISKAVREEIMSIFSDIPSGVIQPWTWNRG